MSADLNFFSSGHLADCNQACLSVRNLIKTYASVLIVKNLMCYILRKLGISKWPFRERISRSRRVDPPSEKSTLQRLPYELIGETSRADSEDDEIDLMQESEASQSNSNDTGDEEWYAVLPRSRRKADDTASPADRGPVRVTKALLESYFNVPLLAAAKALVCFCAVDPRDNDDAWSR
jgi:hypothetical protein